MLDAGIDINDPLIVDRSIAKSGDIVIALIDNDFTVKRLMIDSQFHPPKVWLKQKILIIRIFILKRGKNWLFGES